eukprot:546602-Pyramimonas_sp.AAC.1
MGANLGPLGIEGFAIRVLEQLVLERRVAQHLRVLQGQGARHRALELRGELRDDRRHAVAGLREDSAGPTEHAPAVFDLRLEPWPL